MPNATAGQVITLTPVLITGGVKDVIEWLAALDTNGDGYATDLGTYNLETEGHYTAPDDEVEGDTGTYAFSFPFTIPEDAEVADEFTVRFTENDSGGEFSRYSGVYTVTSVLSGQMGLTVGIGIGI